MPEVGEDPGAPQPVAGATHLREDEPRGADVVPPELRRTTVLRTALVATLLGTTAHVVTIVAPPGYGKTTLLAQWAERLSPRVAWVTCDHVGNDPAALWTSVISAVQRLAPPGWTAPELPPQLWGELAGISTLLSELSEIGGPIVLMLDHVESVQGRDCWTSLSEFVLRLPAGWQVAFGSRDALPLPLSRLRLRGDLLQIGADDLAMSPDEARELAMKMGVDVDQARARELVRGTEGWPAGVYLASLAMNEGVPTTPFRFTGDDRLMRDYLRAELLPRVSAARQEFLMRTSILHRLSGPLCDRVLGATGSARTLEELEAHNMLIVPLDRRGEWYRYHHLLRDLMLSELRKLDPSAVVDLHRRASAWFHDNDMPDAAISHAQASGDADLVARLVLDAMQPAWASGRLETVWGWMDWLSAHPPAEFYPPIAAHGALIFALLGRSADAERWVAVAEGLPLGGVLPDGSTQEGTLAYLRANLARHGPSGMRRDADTAMAGLSAVSPYRSTMVYTIGVSHLLAGDLQRAESVLVEALDLALGDGVTPLAALIGAERHLVALAAGDPRAADTHLDKAMAMVEDARLESFWTSALPLAAAARASAHRGELLEARKYARRAARLRPLLTHVLPVVSVQSLLQLTQAYLEIIDPAGARAALDQASAILLRRPDLGTLGAEAEDLKQRLGRITKAEEAGVSSLTAAELRLLPLLPTHLSFPQIADQLHVSPHTVKTQVTAVYRKLGVSSRSDAVERINALGVA